MGPGQENAERGDTVGEAETATVEVEHADGRVPRLSIVEEEVLIGLQSTRGLLGPLTNDEEGQAVVASQYSVDELLDILSGAWLGHFSGDLVISRVRRGRQTTDERQWHVRAHRYSSSCLQVSKSGTAMNRGTDIEPMKQHRLVSLNVECSQHESLGEEHVDDDEPE